MSDDLDMHPPPDREHARQIIHEEHKHYHANGNGVQAKLYNVVLMVAAGALALLMSLILWQQQRNGDRLDDLSERMAAVETLVETLVERRK